jgi:hypothetical protein
VVRDALRLMWASGASGLCFDDFDIWEELVEGAGYPAMQGIRRQGASQAGAAETDLQQLSFQRHDLDGSAMIMLDVGVQFLYQSPNLLFL